ncbi:MAG TPA: F0F1 ATP synthase subunit alpha [Ignavibacteriaceae bacterium]|nr:F0F1 ATP synthase subunit alpha [Ignavibacteriaceae bacterium]
MSSLEKAWDLESQRIFIRTPDDAGRVLSFADGVATVSGLYDVRIGEKLIFEDSYNHAVDEEGPDEPEIFGVVEDIDEFSVKCLVFGEERFVKQGDRVRSDKRELKIPVTADLLGKVIDPFCRVMPVEKNDKGKAKWFKVKDDVTPKNNPKKVTSVADEILQLPIERTAPSITDRAQISDPMVTGVKAIDSMLPIGKGQRMLLIGDRSTGKTALAVDMIINQAKINKELNQDNPSFESHHKDTVYCIYVAIGKKVSEIKQLYNQLASKEKGDVNAMNYTIIIAATANDPAPLLYAAPFSGCTIGEFFRDMGKNALIIYDDLTKHANAYRQISLLLKRPPGREAYPGDIFYLHSRLLERAAKINDKHTEVYVDHVIKPDYGDFYNKGQYKIKGNGSLTAIPMVETKLNDYSSYISTNIISITDGQIFLSEDLKNQGIMPAVNVGLSVSRVGGKAQYPWMQFVSKDVREIMAEFREKEKYKAYNPDPSEEDRRILDRGERFVHFFKQKQYNPVDPKREVLGLIALKAGFFDLVKNTLECIANYEEYLWKEANKQILKLIDNFDNQGVKITPEDVSTLIDFFDKAETAYLESKLKDEFYANKLKTKKEANIDYTKVDLQLKNISRESTRVCKMIESAREGLKKK